MKVNFFIIMEPFRKNKLTLKIWQYSTLLPFQYNEEKNYFCYSKFHHYYSILISGFMLLFGIFSIIKWISRSKYDTKFVNQIDIICIFALWTLYLIICFLILRDKFFHIHDMIKYANEILKFNNFIKNRNLKFGKYLLHHTFLHVLIFPITIFIVNFTFFSFYLYELEMVIYCVMISTTTSYVRIAFFPLIMIFNYFELILNDFIRQKPVLIFTKNCIKRYEFINKYSVVYSKMIEILKFIEQFYGINFILYLFGLHFAIVWMWYRSIDLLFFQITQYSFYNNVCYIPILYSYYACNAFIIFRSSSLLFKSIGAIQIKVHTMKMIVNDMIVESLLKGTRLEVCTIIKFN